MTIGLPAIATLSYNGYTFDGTARVKVRQQMIRDDANRTVILIETELLVEAVIASGDGSTTDASVDKIRAALTCDGGVLTYSNAGLSSLFSINTAILKDVRWGPQTKIISWNPIGSHGACEIVWSVITRTPPCTTAPYTGVMALNYESTFDIDEAGDTTRVLDGYFEIAQTRINNVQPCQSRALPDSCDNYREQIFPQPPLGFKRKQSYKNSKNKCRCDFQITDQQIPSPNAYPPGVTMITARNRIKMSRHSLAHNRGTFNVSVTMSRGVSGSQGWMIFWKLFALRKAAIEASQKKIIIVEIEADESLYSREANFRCEYYIMGVIQPVDFLKTTGFWQLTQDTWGAWALSLANTMFSPRGSAKMVDAPQNDVILDLCGRPTSNNISPVNATNDPRPFGAPVFQSSTPDPTNWLSFIQKTIVHTFSPTVSHNPLQASPGSTNSAGGTANSSQGSSLPNPDSPSPTDAITAAQDQAFNAQQDARIAAGSNNGAMGNQDGAFVQSGTDPGTKPVIIQKRGIHSLVFRLIGSATRPGFEVPRPGVQYVNNVPAYEIGGTFVSEYMGSCFGVPLFRAHWDLLYKLPNGPTTMLVKPNLTPVEQ